MKCERCNSLVKKGEVFCNNCGARIKKNVDNTMNIDVLKNKNEKEDDDIFYQKGLEKRGSLLNVLLVILVLLLSAGIIYLMFFDKKEEGTNNIGDSQNKTPLYKDIYYNNYQLSVLANTIVKYNEDKIMISNDNYSGSIYTDSLSYEKIISNIDEIVLKWEEFGIKTTSLKYIENNTYEITGTYNNKYLVFLLKNMDGVTLISYFQFNSSNLYDDNKEEILNISKSIKLSNSNTSIENSYIYPEFNLDPIGSQ